MQESSRLAGAECRFLTAIPVYNEERHLERVLTEVRRYSPHILVVNDGSTDRTGEIARPPERHARHHPPAQPRLRGGPDLRFRLTPWTTTTTCW